ncbi:SDR family NAD(P)-dependent oxidoreductase [Hymenobacter crusticola]|uniref:D-alanyl-lipoteichoic acid biosynthesis protein n=1 Tax=Hymenobacter crusticola TaxID=1770526 RepID=A0A243W5U3_9BACT|nr:SDR family NAD(P)-dependent oxidoreductase [Hymenobacter crusticola]OUJ68991.1 D-alanyl-lipoteichoic acid biosynthesis protein [Hymenobacter crusticola]
MNVQQASVLITGGSEGIGLGLAVRFLQAGSQVLITGRDADKLMRAAAAWPGLQTLVNDLSKPAQREDLARHIQRTMPSLNVVVNNAGIQRRVGLAQDQAPWAERQQEVDLLLAAPVHLNHLLVPLLLTQPQASLVVNVTSGGAYIPQVFAPLYSACKAAVHSYTLTLRQALTGTACRVVELIPPAVRTALAGPGATHGVPVNEFCDAVFPQLLQEEVTEIGYGPTAAVVPQLGDQPVNALFQASTVRFPTATYANRTNEPPRRMTPPAASTD